MPWGLDSTSFYCSTFQSAQINQYGSRKMESLILVVKNRNGVPPFFILFFHARFLYRAQGRFWYITSALNPCNQKKPYALRDRQRSGQDFGGDCLTTALSCRHNTNVSFIVVLWSKTIVYSWHSSHQNVQPKRTCWQSQWCDVWQSAAHAFC